MILVFNLSDILGRYSCNLLVVSSLPLLWVFSTLRILFIPSFCLVSWSTEGDSLSFIFGSDVFKLLNMAAFAYSTGFMTTTLMMQASIKAQDKLKDKVGYLMTSSIIFGILSGQAVSYLFQ